MRRIIFALALGVIVVVGPVMGVASAALPDGRVYEMVSPAEKNGGDAFPVEVLYGLPYATVRFPLIASTTGEAVLFGSDSPFAGATIGGQNAYYSKRTSTGWATQAISPPSAITHPAPSFGMPGSIDATADLSTVMFGVTYGGGFESFVTDVDVLIAHGADGTNTQVDLGSLGGPGNGAGSSNAVAYGGMSGDGSHVVFDSKVPLQPPVSPSDKKNHIYVRDRAANTTSVVDILPNNTLSTSPAWLGAMAGYGGSGLESKMNRDAVSADGSRIFWTTEPEPRPLYARVDESHTVPISAAQCSGSCAAPTRGAQFQDASADGSQVFFISDGQLTNVVPNVALNQKNLYRYDFNAPPGKQLTLISPQGLGSGTTGFGLVGASQNGKIAYFLSPNKYNGNGVPGSPNLYVNEGGTVSFIATLSTKDKVLLINKPYAFGDEGAVQARVTPDGRHLVFQSFEKLTTAYGNAGHGEIYRVDLPSTSPSCVSCGSSPAIGGAELTYPNRGMGAGALTAAMRLPHNLSDDGQRVFFETEESLVSQDVNGVNDVYEWNEGTVSLISGGTGPMPSFYIGASESYDASRKVSVSRDVFFVTYDQLVPSDTDTSYDIYDARIGGGFSPAPAPAPECAGDGCRSTPSPPLFAAPASAAFAGVGNLTPAAVKPLTRAQKLAKALRACRKKPVRKRASCVRRARQRFAATSHATKSNRRGN